MTIQHLINWFTENQYLVLGYFLSILILSLFIVLIINKTNISSLKYVLSIIVYAVTVPGILAFILILYAVFIQKTNILNVSVIAYFVPIISTILTLFILKKKVHMSQIPGFGKLSALMILITITFLIVFVLQKTYFGVFFVGGFTQLLIIFVVLFIILRVAWTRITK